MQVAIVHNIPPTLPNDKYLFDNIDKDVDVYSTNETIALRGDFNA